MILIIITIMIKIIMTMMMMMIIKIIIDEQRSQNPTSLLAIPKLIVIMD